MDSWTLYNTQIEGSPHSEYPTVVQMVWTESPLEAHQEYSTDSGTFVPAYGFMEQQTGTFFEC